MLSNMEKLKSKKKAAVFEYIPTNRANSSVDMISYDHSYMYLDAQEYVLVCVKYL